MYTKKVVQIEINKDIYAVHIIPYLVKHKDNIPCIKDRENVMYINKRVFL